MYDNTNTYAMAFNHQQLRMGQMHDNLK